MSSQRCIPQIDCDATNLDAALAYAVAGLHVLPVRRGTKNPGSIVGTDWERRASADAEQIAAWFASTDDDVAIATGPSGLVVFDVDNASRVPGEIRSAIDQLHCPFQATRFPDEARGHYWFAQPASRRIGNSKGTLASGWGDVRGHGGAIMVFPSHHAHGGHYQWLRCGPIPELPDYLAVQLQDKASNSDRHPAREVLQRLLEDDAGPMDPEIAATRDKWISKMVREDCGHDNARDAQLEIMALAAVGGRGYREALEEVKAAFMQVITRADREKSRSQDEAETEWERMLYGSGIGDLIARKQRPSTTQEIILLTNPAEVAIARRRFDEAAMQSGVETLGPPETNANRGVEFIDGAQFILDDSVECPAIWGRGDQVLWADGESLMIAGGQGLGKTTIAGQLVKALLGVNGYVLNLPVRNDQSKILYLAMDRPRQIQRSLARQFTAEHRDVLKQRLIIRKGPPERDLAKSPELLDEMAAACDASVVFVDSLKDAAIGLSEDEVAAGWNRARQSLLASGRQIVELHHVTKANPDSLNGVYGSTWLTSGCGSVVLLCGEAGDPIVSFRHVKQPIAEVGPHQLRHDGQRGEIVVYNEVDLVELAASYAQEGLSARAAAVALYHPDDEAPQPAKAEIQKARRRLEGLENEGRLTRFDRPNGRKTPTAIWFPIGL